MLKMIITYTIEDIIANNLKALTSILIVPVLNNSITVGSNSQYANTIPKTKFCAIKYAIKPNKTENPNLPLFIL